MSALTQTHGPYSQRAHAPQRPNMCSVTPSAEQSRSAQAYDRPKCMCSRRLAYFTLQAASCFGSLKCCGNRNRTGPPLSMCSLNSAVVLMLMTVIVVQARNSGTNVLAELRSAKWMGCEGLFVTQ